jgi:ABC-2 type transport system permease protein
MIYGTSLLTNEIEDRSITQVITAPLDRRIAYLGYYLALAVTMTIVLVIINVSGWLAFFSQRGMDSDSLSILAAMTVLSILGGLAYSALFLLAGVLLKKPVFFGLFYAFIWESFIGSIPGAISHYTVRHFVRSIGSEWLELGSIGVYEGSGVGVSIAVLVTATAFMVFLGAVMFREKEFP